RLWSAVFRRHRHRIGIRDCPDRKRNAEGQRPGAARGVALGRDGHRRAGGGGLRGGSEHRSAGQREKPGGGRHQELHRGGENSLAHSGSMARGQRGRGALKSIRLCVERDDCEEPPRAMTSQPLPRWRSSAIRYIATGAAVVVSWVVLHTWGLGKSPFHTKG